MEIYIGPCPLVGSVSGAHTGETKAHMNTEAKFDFLEHS